MRVLQISADRSKRGILYPDSAAFKRQEAYARTFGNLDVIAFSLEGDPVDTIEAGPLRIFPTNAPLKLLYGWYAMRVARTLPKPDVVTTQDPFETGWAASLIARKLQVPLHVQVHTDFLSPEYAKHSIINRIRVYIARKVLARATRIRTVSHRIKESLQKWGITAPITVLPIYVDTSVARNVEDITRSRPFTRFHTKVLVVARLEPEKDVALAIFSFAESAPDTACLIIVGDGSDRHRLEELARTLNVQERVFFEGTQEPAVYYALCDLVLVTSRYEGYGMVIIEALAVGKPVISTDVGVAREMGAIVASREELVSTLRRWFATGPREGKLVQYPYGNFDEYLYDYCADITAAKDSTVSRN